MFEIDDAASGTNGSPPQTAETLFFGLHVPGASIEPLERMCAALRREHAIDGFQIAGERMHVTLTEPGKPRRLRAAFDKALELAAGSVDLRAFDLALDRAVAFKGSNAVVLLADAASTAQLDDLRRRIVEKLAHHGIHAPNVARFTPYLTLFYASSVRLDERAIEPIRWRVDRFRLIRSFIGKSHHQIEGQWLLRTP